MSSDVHYSLIVVSAPVLGKGILKILLSDPWLMLSSGNGTSGSWDSPFEIGAGIDFTFLCKLPRFKVCF